MVLGGIIDFGILGKQNFFAFCQGVKNVSSELPLAEAGFGEDAALGLVVIIDFEPRHNQSIGRGLQMGEQQQSRGKFGDSSDTAGVNAADMVLVFTSIRRAGFNQIGSQFKDAHPVGSVEGNRPAQNEIQQAQA